jgi:hypothetical protein
MCTTVGKTFADASTKLGVPTKFPVEVTNRVGVPLEMLLPEEVKDDTVAAPTKPPAKAAIRINQFFCTIINLFFG